MGLYKYSHKEADEKQLARAQMHDVNASYKDFTQVLAAIKNKNIADATQILTETISMKKAIPYVRFAKGIGHRSELGGKKGRYPKKEAKLTLALLQNAVANAENKGLDKNSLYIKAASAHKQNALMRYRKYWASGVILGYGKQSVASKYVTCWVEITLAEKHTKTKTAPVQSAKEKIKSAAKNTAHAAKEPAKLAHVHSTEKTHAHEKKESAPKSTETHQEKKHVEVKANGQ